jgi:hypothetical protein
VLGRALEGLDPDRARRLAERGARMRGSRSALGPDRPPSGYVVQVVEQTLLAPAGCRHAASSVFIGGFENWLECKQGSAARRPIRHQAFTGSLSTR